MTFQQAQMDAKAEGIEIGRRIGRNCILQKLVKEGILTIEEASEQANMSVNDFKALLQKEYVCMDDLNRFLQEQLKDPAFRAEYENFRPEFEIMKASIAARCEQGFTQKELAKRLE